MEKLDLFLALGEVDDGILEDAEAFLRTPARRHTLAERHAPAWVRWGSLAACATLALCWFTTGRTADLTDPRALEELPVSQSEEPSQAVGEPVVDAPATESEKLTRPVVEMNFNELTEALPQATYSLFALLTEDFVPMTQQELLDYYGVALPVEELFPLLSAVGPEEGDGFGRGIYRREGGEPYFDTNTFSFESADGVLAVYVSLDKVFHLPASSWELPGDELRFTGINGWELALFRYPDEEGNGCFHTEFRQNGVNFCVTGKNLAEGEFAALLEALLEPRENHAPGEVRTVTGTVSAGISKQTLTASQLDGDASAGTFVEVSYQGPLGLAVNDGGDYSFLRIELTPEQAFRLAELSVGDQVTVRFTGEPATIGTVWNQQLVSIVPV